MRKTLSILAFIAITPIALLCGALVWSEQRQLKRRYRNERY
jgi:hypothetical protein